MQTQPLTVAKATLKAMPSGTAVEVQFNPASMVYSVDNSVAQQSGPPKKAQYVAQFSGKLTMDLQFDTTGTGTDVRIDTNKVALFMQATGTAQAGAQNAAQNAAPPSSNGGTQPAPAKAPPVLQFQWGTYIFQGIMDSFKETIDFFSADGIALRALVSIGLSRQDQVFDEGQNFSSASTAGSLVPTASGDSALSAATRGGDPGAARQLGTDNGLESLRFTGGASLQVNAGTTSNAPAPFATVSAGAGASFGVSASASAGASVGISSGATASPTANAASAASAANGLGATFGGSASAGVPATSGAFAGLQSGRVSTSTTANLNPQQMLPSTVGSSVSTFAGATYSLGGAARSTGSSGLSSDVGASFSFSDRLTFGGDT
jgi:hypothetical protein